MGASKRKRLGKEALLAPRNDTAHGMPEADVEITGKGIVRVRGLSRGEVFRCQKLAESTEALECKIIAFGMVEPAMTEAEVRQWGRNAPAGEFEPVVDKIKELSGLSDGASKSGVQGVRGGPGDGVRALPGGEAVDDGDPAADGDAER